MVYMGVLEWVGDGGRQETDLSDFSETNDPDSENLLGLFRARCGTLGRRHLDVVQVGLWCESSEFGCSVGVELIMKVQCKETIESDPRVRFYWRRTAARGELKTIHKFVKSLRSGVSSCRRLHQYPALSVSVGQWLAKHH